MRCRATVVTSFLFAFTLLFAAVAQPVSAASTFVHDEVAKSAANFEALLKARNDPGSQSARTWLRIGLKAMLKGDPRLARAAFSAAATRSPDDANIWLRLKEAIEAIKPADSNERYQLPEQATSAAYLAYRRAKTDVFKAQAAASLAAALGKRQYWRPALNAYKASLSLNEVAVIRAAYETMREEHGFRILDYTVESDALQPRMCVQFSEKLSKGRVDFSSFVRVDGKDAAAVKASGQQICVEGLQHGERYQVAIRSGLPSNVGEVLTKAGDFTVYVRDRQPAVRFVSRNYVLPRTGQNGLPIVSVNTKAIMLEVYRIGDRGLGTAIVDNEIQTQLYGSRVSELAATKGEKVWTGQMPVKSALNEDVTTAFPVSKALPDMKPGVYVLVATPTDKETKYWDEQATQWFVVSDLGIAAMSGAKGIDAFVRSLASADALTGVTVRLIARNNNVLATGKTDAQGHVHFDAGLTRGEGGNQPAVLVARSKDGDYGFINLTKAGFDLSDRGVAGRAAPGAMDAYVFTERGVYRPGAEVHITALLRDKAGKAVKGVPLTLQIDRPDGVEYRKILVADEAEGGRSIPVPLLSTATTGTWRVFAFADPKSAHIGETTFLVEDFVPDRMAMTLESKSKSAAPDKPATFSVEGRYLYGAPASGLSLEGDIIVAPREKDFEDFAGYKFGLSDDPITAIRQPLFELPQTDAAGKAVVTAPLPTLPQTTRPLVAKVSVRLRESGGRAISKSSTLPIEATGPMIGVKPQFSKGHVGEGTEARFDVAVRAPDGKRAALDGIGWELFKVTQRYQWYRQNGSWYSEPVTYSERVAEGKLDAKADGATTIGAPVTYGRYRLDLAQGGPDGPATSYPFTAGWYSSDAAKTPDFLDISLDKARYRPGDTAQVRIVPRGAGKAVVTIVNDGVVAMKSVAVTKDGATVSFPVSPEWGPGTYVTANLYRPMDVGAKQMPRRSVGVSWLGVDRSERTLGVELTLPETIRPRGDLVIPIGVSGLAPGEKAHMVVAAVDVGILNLTNYKPPAPESWYFGQRRLGVELRDLYGQLIDGMRASPGRLRSGGDGIATTAKGNPPAQAPVSLFSGIVSVDENGKAEVQFEVPAFNGTLRVMAAAWTGDKLGHGTKDLIVRDPVVLTASLPRFLNEGDTSRMHVSIDNVDGAAGDYELTLQIDGPVKAKGDTAKTLKLSAGGKADIAIPILGAKIGDATITASLSGPDGLALDQQLSLRVRAPSPEISRRNVHELIASTGTIKLSEDLFADFVPGTGKVTVSVAPGAALDVPGMLLALDRYPHGCAEQITSRALPLLYVNTIAERTGLGSEKAIPERIQAAIDRLLGHQSSSGGFGLWSAGGGDLWLTSYITDFLNRAREQKYQVPDQAYESALDRLQNFVANTSDVRGGGEPLAYALYVLARSGRASIGDLRYFADAKLDAFATPFAKAQLAASLSMYGDTDRAKSTFRAAMSALDQATADKTRTDFGSSLRDRAGILTIAAETGIDASAIPAIAKKLDASRSNRTFTSTQENAWLILAARALFDQAGKLSLEVANKTHKGAYFGTYSAEDLANGEVAIVNKGDAAVSATVTVTGIPTTPEPPASKGFTIERRVFSMEGKPLVLEKVEQNQRVVVLLQVAEAEAKRARIIVVDSLPAGFEIENPRLTTKGGRLKLPWLVTQGFAEHTEYRDDHFKAAFNRASKKPGVISVAYVMRAVTPGNYIQPPALVEDMYRPERIARTETGTVEITAPRR